jgi:hypothetical protein
MVEIHDVMRVATTTVRTKHFLGTTNATAIPLNPPILELHVIELMLLIILALIAAVASTTPVLRFAVGPNSEFGQGQILLAFRADFHR